MKVPWQRLPAWTVWKAGQEWIASGKCVVPGENQSPCAAARVESHRWLDSSRWNAVPCRPRRSIRWLQDAATVRAASWHMNDGALGLAAGLSQRLLAPVLEHALNRIRQVFQGLLTRHSLSVRLGHLRTGRNQVFFPTLDDGGELIHARSLSAARQAFNLLSHLEPLS